MSPSLTDDAIAHLNTIVKAYDVRGLVGQTLTTDIGAASAATMSVVSVWPTRPRTSYALTMVFRWAMASSVRLGLMPKTYLTEHVAHHPVAHNLPALRRRGACCVPLAQVVGMRFTGRGQGAEHGHRIGVDEGECGHSGVGAGDSGARPD